ncbi:MAG: response regulator [Terracidiphilus sp.]
MDARAPMTRTALREPRGPSARILLVEDNLTNQEVAAGMLRKLGWNADVASNGRQALEALAREHYDVVLMDVEMPEMDGHEATRRIRDPQSGVLDPNIPVIALTAHSMAENAGECFASGMSDYISKPIDGAILADVVEKWLQRKRHRFPAETPVESLTKSAALPAKPASQPAVFNREAFLQRMMGDEGFAREIVGAFLEELPALLAALKAGAGQQNLESIGKQAHKIKGSAANVGGEALRNAALQVETAARAGDTAGVAAAIPDLERQSAHFEEALRHWLIPIGCPPGNNLR